MVRMYMLFGFVVLVYGVRWILLFVKLWELEYDIVLFDIVKVWFV